MPQTKVSGVIKNLNAHPKNENGWQNYDVTFEDGGVYRMGFPPNVSYVPKEGEVIGAFQNVRGDRVSWILDCSTYLTEDRSALLNPDAKANAPKNGKPASSGPVRTMTRDDYWKNKDLYERTTRDPKIEFQTYYRIVADVYIAAIPHLEHTLKDTNDIDGYLDEIYFKTMEVFKRRQQDEESRQAA